MKNIVSLLIVSFVLVSPLMANEKVCVSGKGSYHHEPSRPPMKYYHPRYYGGPDYLNSQYAHRVTGRRGHPNHTFYHHKRNHGEHPYNYHSDYYKADPR